MTAKTADLQAFPEMTRQQFCMKCHHRWELYPSETMAATYCGDCHRTALANEARVNQLAKETADLHALVGLLEEEIEIQNGNSTETNYCWWCQVNVNGIDGPAEPHDPTCWLLRARAVLAAAPPPGTVVVTTGFSSLSMAGGSGFAQPSGQPHELTPQLLSAASKESGRPCGCDPAANWVCEAHR